MARSGANGECQKQAEEVWDRGCADCVVDRHGRDVDCFGGGAGYVFLGADEDLGRAPIARP